MCLCEFNDVAQNKTLFNRVGSDPLKPLIGSRDFVLELNEIMKWTVRIIVTPWVLRAVIS